MAHNKILLNILASMIFIALSGCGGGGTDSTQNTPSGQPHQLTAKDLQTVDVLSQRAFPAPTVMVEGSKLIITHTGSIASDENTQFYLNIDNDAATGFRFDSEAWDETGADYIVENGHLFKSTANDSSWSWDTNAGDVTYSRTANSVSVSIDQSLLKGLSPQIRVGFVIRDNHWAVTSIWPGSSLMALYTIDVVSPPDTISPEITLNGSQNITVVQNSAFTDPGATAIDNVDGDLTSAIKTQSNLDITVPGTYQITYTVSDQAGNQALLTRTVMVTAAPVEGIVIDGQINDWANIPVVAQSVEGSLKLTDDGDNLYILVDASNMGKNTQIFLDTDNNSATGFLFSGDVWSQGGADYMIENNHLDKAKGNVSSWSWDYHFSPIDFLKTGNIIEVAVPKSALKNLSDTISVGFVNRDADWQVESVLPVSGMVSYSLLGVQANLALLPGFCGTTTWETDGTPENTRLSPIGNIEGPAIKHNGNWYGVFNDTLYNAIVKFDGSNVQEIVKFDRETTQVYTNLRNLSFVGDSLFFVANGQIWVTNEGVNTHQVDIIDSNLALATDIYLNYNIVSTQDYLLAEYANSDGVPKLLRINANGEVNLIDSFPEQEPASHLNFYPVSSNVIFIGITSSFGPGGEIWKLDLATSSAELLPYAAEESVQPVGSVPGKLYFTKHIGSAYELWALDDTVQKMITTFNTLSSTDSSPYLVSSNGALYFVSSDRVSNSLWTKSLWRVDEINNEKVLLGTTETGSSGFSEFVDAYFLAGKDYALRNDSSVSGYFKHSSLLAFGETESVVVTGTRVNASNAVGWSTWPEFSFQDGVFYLSAYTDAADPESQQFIGYLNQEKAQVKILAYCNQ